MAAPSSSASAAGVDPMALLRGYTDEELAVAAEFLATWFPFLSAGLCPSCVSSLRARVDSLLPPAEEAQTPPPPPLRIDQIEPSGWDSDPAPPPHHLPFEPSGWDSDPAQPPPQQQAEKPKMSWADMAQEDELTAAAAEEDAMAAAAEDGEEASEVARQKVQLSRDQREQRRYQNVVRKKDFRCMERVRGRIVNVLEGLELHTGVFSSAEQKRIVECVYDLQERGKRGELGDRTYSEPQKWMRGKGRVTIQFGCCYNYATDKNGNPPGIMRTVVSDPLPGLLKTMVKRLIRWNVLPSTCVPDSCIVNIYEPGDCIPPHIDSHDFVRPFCTVSFLSECNILFGSTLKVAGPGEFIGSFAIPLPVGSVLVMNGNGADVAKHCVPAVPTKRISITFRKMDPTKRPFSFKDDPELLNIAPLDIDIQDAGRSSDEGSSKTPDTLSSKTPDTLIRNLSKISRGKRYNGRTSAGKAERGILGEPPAVDALSKQNLHGHHNVSAASYEGERNYAARSRESRYHSNVPGMPSQVDDFREWPNLPAQGRRNCNGMGSSEDGLESGEKRTRMEHRQISIINRTIKDDMESLSVSSRESADRHRPMVRTIYNKPRRTRVMLDD